MSKKKPDPKKALDDYLEAARQHEEESKPFLDPKEYGFDDEDEMHRGFRKLAGLPEPEDEDDNE